jgi:glycine dehydrogenase subunit 1
MKFIPNSPLKKQILKEIKLPFIEELFVDIPSSVRINDLNLPYGKSQKETERLLRTLANKNKDFNEILIFTGGGIKPHYIPAVVKALTSRSEFYTAYTPYQPEASQGFLKAMFEYQSMIAELTGMDVANSSLYDGATALGEAALMATRITKKNSILIPSNISYEKKSVLSNYAKGANIQVNEFSYDSKSGCIDLNNLEKKLHDKISAVYLEIPNVFGIFENDIRKIEKLVHSNNALLLIGIDPLVLGIIESPGEFGADIVIGEGRCLGNPMNFGGSSLGLFACKQQYIRHIPGRLIGLTQDKEGNEAFCMTLQTREQHIRRGKATSNICTNEGLCALAAVIYLSWLGANGIQRVSKENFEKGQLLKEKISRINNFSEVFEGIHFNEFVIQSDKNAKDINKKLLQENIQGGFLLEKWFPSMKNTFLFGVTENYTLEDINRFIKVLKEVSHV